jgi:hypothetical protein
MTARPGKRILVPVFGGDIGEATLVRARAALDAPGARLVILHVSPTGTSGRAAPVAMTAATVADRAPRWRRLASSAPTFVDAVAGDPAAVIVAQADRFHSDRVLLERPASSDPDGRWLADVIARVERAAPDRVTVVDRRAPRRSSHRRRHGITHHRPQHEEAPCAAR